MSYHLRLIIPMVLALILVTLEVKAASATPETFHFSGQLTDSLSAPVVDASVVFTIKIYNPTESCLLYEEEQTLDLSSSNGNFSLQIGSSIGAAQRSGDDPNNTMSTVFNNSMSNIPCGPTGTYSPSATHSRKLVITVDPASGPAETLAAQDIGAVPFAKNSDLLQGKEAGAFLLVDAGNDVTQANLTSLLNGTNISNLTALAGGTSSLYAKQSAGTVSVPTNATDPGSLAAGKVWFDSTSNVLKYYNGSATKTVMETGGASTDHNALSNLTTGDPHSQYVHSAGRSGGQVIYGGTAASQNLIFDSTSNATKGSVVLALSNSNVGIGTGSPGEKLEVAGHVKVGGHIQVADSATACTNAASDGGKLRYNSTTGYMEYCNHVAGTWSTLRTVDHTPDPYSFFDITGVSMSALQYSGGMTLLNFDGPLTASVSGDGSPEICNLSTGCTFASSVSIMPGQMIQVRATSSALPLTVNSVTVTVGTTSDVWEITTAALDSTPDAFTISNDLGNVAASTLFESNYNYVYGFNTPLTIAVSGDGSPQICTMADGCSSWSTSFSNFNSGDYYRVRTTSSATPGGVQNVTVTVGGVSDVWVVTTVNPASCVGSPAVGQYCTEGTVYAGNFGGFNLMTTPGGCSFSSTPSCPGTIDNLYLSYGASGYFTNAISSSNGLTNTNTLVGGTATWGAVPGAQYCSDLNYGGYTDWYLPAKDELNWLHTNKVAIGGFSNSYYMSSTEATTTYFYEQYFNGGSPGAQYSKSSSDMIRCIRRY